MTTVFMSLFVHKNNISFSEFFKYILTHFSQEYWEINEQIIITYPFYKKKKLKMNKSMVSQVHLP